MIDPFRPLMLTEDAIKIEDPDYYKSWIPPETPPNLTKGDPS